MHAYIWTYIHTCVAGTQLVLQSFSWSSCISEAWLCIVLVVSFLSRFSFFFDFFLSYYYDLNSKQIRDGSTALICQFFDNFPIPKEDRISMLWDRFSADFGHSFWVGSSNSSWVDLTSTWCIAGQLAPTHLLEVTLHMKTWSSMRWCSFSTWISLTRPTGPRTTWNLELSQFSSSIILARLPQKKCLHIASWSISTQFSSRSTQMKFAFYVCSRSVFWVNILSVHSRFEMHSLKRRRPSASTPAFVG